MPVGHPIPISVDFAAPYRVGRIRSELQRRSAAAAHRLTAADMIELQGDTFSMRAAELTPLLLDVLASRADSVRGALSESDERRWAAGVAALSTWNYRLDTNSTGAALFETLFRQLVLAVFHDDLAGDAELQARVLVLDNVSDQFPRFMHDVLHRAAEQADTLAGRPVRRRPRLLGLPLRSGPKPTQQQMVRENAEVDRFCRNVTKSSGSAAEDPLEHTCHYIVSVAFERTLNDLAARLGTADPGMWRWGDVHRSHLPHTFTDVPVLGRVFDRVTAGAGDQHCINAQGNEVHPADLGRLHSYYGPGFRMVVDMGDIRRAVAADNGSEPRKTPVFGSWLQIESGQSGHVFSPHYDDQMLMFRPRDGGTPQLWHMPFSRRRDNVRGGQTLRLVPREADTAGDESEEKHTERAEGVQEEL